MRDTYLSTFSRQCWSWSYWHLYYHRPRAGAGKRRELCQHTSSDQQDQATENENGADCGRWCVHASLELILISWCIGFQPFIKPTRTLHVLPLSILLQPSLFPHPLSKLPLINQEPQLPRPQMALRARC